METLALIFVHIGYLFGDLIVALILVSRAMHTAFVDLIIADSYLYHGDLSYAYIHGLSVWITVCFLRSPVTVALFWYPLIILLFSSSILLRT